MSTWASEHWFLTFVLACLTLGSASNIISRTYRMIMVLTRGWPTAPNMDADGDIVHKEESP